MSSTKEARRGLRVYLIVLLAITSLLVFILWINSRLAQFPAGVLLLSCSPAIASVIARLALRDGFEDVSFRLRGDWAAQSMLIAWLWPVLGGTITYGAAWLAGVTQFRLTSAGPPFGTWGPEKLIGISIVAMPVFDGFLVRLVSCLLFTVVCCVQSFGEEIGWRGYMLTRLFDARVRAPVFWNGLAWGLWHFPSLLTRAPSRPTEPRLVSFSFFVAGTICASYLLAYLRLRSGSVWPAVLGHASYNCVLAMAFDGFTAATPVWRGELHLLSVAVIVVIMLLVRPAWVVRHRPDTDASTISQN